jgi:hypothetical protein
MSNQEQHCDFCGEKIPDGDAVKVTFTDVPDGLDICQACARRLIAAVMAAA